jgi:hypothetical protein
MKFVITVEVDIMDVREIKVSDTNDLFAVVMYVNNSLI